MSRIGKQPIIIPEGVTLKTEGEKVMVSGPKGEFALTIPPGVEVKVDRGEVICQVKKGQNNLWGLTRTLIANATIGVSQGWTKTLELVGVGFRAVVEGPARSASSTADAGGEELVLTVGFSHLVRFKAPAGITFSVSENKIQIAGVDKQLVGEIAARLRRIRPPEPYKGKGIKYQGEKIRRKIGKAAKTIGVSAGARGKS